MKTTNKKAKITILSVLAIITCLLASLLIVFSQVGIANATAYVLEGFENGFGEWYATPYPVHFPEISTDYVHHGSYSLKLLGHTASMCLDVTNPDPQGTVYLAAWVRYDPFTIPSGWGSVYEDSPFEMRSTAYSVIGFPEARSTDYGNTLYWDICWFDMTTGNHHIGARSHSTVLVSPNTWQKVVVRYDHTSTHVTLRLYINQEYEGTPDATIDVDASFNYVANNIYAGGLKTQDGYLTSYKYLDCMYFGNTYPVGDPVGGETTPTPTPTINPTPTPAPSTSPELTPTSPPQPTPTASPLPETRNSIIIMFLIIIFSIVGIYTWRRGK